MIQDNFFNNKYVRIIIPIIWGFALALILRRTCKNDKCIIVRPPIDFDSRIIKNGNKCYTLKRYPHKCDI